MDSEPIPYNRPYMTGHELQYMSEAHGRGKLAGDGEFTRFCHGWLESRLGCGKALLAHSCTAALEMCALLLDVAPGEEVIMPSFTFVSTANAFVLRGGVPVFVDIREDTLNIDENLVEAAITDKTRAIVVVHYAGVACEMDSICEIAARHDLPVIEDAAQGILSTYRGRHLGSIGELAALSFHETKNVMAGEGGALLINDRRHMENAEIVREKGTDRSKFFRGEVDRYTWQMPGSSFLPGELIAAFLRSQLEYAEKITSARMELWQNYHALLDIMEREGLVRRPVIPSSCTHNAHIYHILLAPEFDRDAVLSGFREQDIYPVFHYVPLHSSPAGCRYGRASGSLDQTETAAGRLIRLPLWIGLQQSQQERIVAVLERLLRPQT